MCVGVRTDAVSIVYPHNTTTTSQDSKKSTTKNHHHAVGTCLTHALMSTRYENVRFLGGGGGGKEGQGRGKKRHALATH
jgi:hypothetical protein